MSYTPFLRKQYVKGMFTGKELELGAFDLVSACALESIIFDCFVSSLIVTPFTVTVNIYESPTREVPVFTSVPLLISATSLGQTKAWIGRIEWEFLLDSPLNPNLKYYITMTSSDYVGDMGSSFYFSVLLDWGVTINTSTSMTAAGGKGALLVKS